MKKNKIISSIALWTIAMSSITPAFAYLNTIENASFENYETVLYHGKKKDKNKAWIEAKVDSWIAVDWSQINKNSTINFSQLEWWKLMEVWKNFWRHTDYWNHQIELDFKKDSVDAIYQEFETTEKWTLMFNAYARKKKVQTNDIEVYIDGKYKETVRPKKKYITYYYDLNPGKHSILLKEVNEQDNGLWAVIDNVVFFTESNIRKITPHNNGLSKKAVKVITNDKGLRENTIFDDIIDWAYSANEMSNLIFTEIKKLGYMDDAKFSRDEMKAFNQYMFDNFHDEMMKLHGDDERWEETGYHKVQNDGATTYLNVPWVRKDKNAVNTIWDGIFHFGLFASVNDKKILNEDWNRNQTWSNLAKYMNFCLNEELAEIQAELDRKLAMEKVIWNWVWEENGEIIWAAINRKKSKGLALFENKKLNNNSEVSFTLNWTDEGKWQNGFIIFDYKSDKDFKFAWAWIGADRWAIGHYTESYNKRAKFKWIKFINKAFLKETIDTNQDYNLEVKFNNWEVKLIVDWKEKVSHNFWKSFNSKLGYALERAKTSFKNIEIN